jgi:3'-phosphoadenosine 5'-phosphosulfate sulfotransferase (PAPS reductase)/FAD synthetase
MPDQLPLFESSRPPRAIEVLPVLQEVLARADAALFISISGGKDGQAMLSALSRKHRELGWRCGLFAIHADLGRAEWPQSLPHCEKICEEAGVPLTIVNRPQGDLVQEIEDRMHKLSCTERMPWPTATQRYCTADQKRSQLAKAKRKPFWPDAQNRYCTSDQKRTQIDKELRAYRLVVSAIGIRGQESRARAKKADFDIDRDLTGKAYRDLTPVEALDSWSQEDNGRLAFDWLPIFDWSIDEVWEECGTSEADLDLRRQAYAAGYEEDALEGWPLHPAYVFGNERVSCVFCVLATQSDLAVGARHNPELFRHYVGLEQSSGFTFQYKKALADVAPQLLEGKA